MASHALHTVPAKPINTALSLPFFFFVAFFDVLTLFRPLSLFLIDAATAAQPKRVASCFPASSKCPTLRCQTSLRGEGWS